MRASARQCGYSRSGVRIVIFHARMVFAGANLVPPVIRPFSLCFRSRGPRALDYEQELYHGTDRSTDTVS